MRREPVFHQYRLPSDNTVFTGDNLPVMRGLPDSTVDLVYLDPPFNKGKVFHAPPESESAGSSFRDKWSWDADHQERLSEIPDVRYIVEGARKAHSASMAAFLCFLAVRLMEVHRLLRGSGSVYVHCDPTASHYLKMLLDGIFGSGGFRNEIIWQRMSGTKSQARRYFSQHDVLLYYVKSSNATWNGCKEPLTQEEIEASWFRYTDADGRRYKIGDLTTPSNIGGHEYEFLGSTRRWIYRQDRMEQLLADPSQVLYSWSGEYGCRKEAVLG